MIRYAAQARRDVDEIETYSFDNFGPELSYMHIETMRARLLRIGELPGIGRPVLSYDGLRQVLCEQHAIYYRAAGPDVEIVRILHQRMDPDLHL